MKPTSPVLPNAPNVKETTLAKDQPEYQPLPVAHIYYDGTKSMISRWTLTWRERVKIFLTGHLWIEQLTGNQLLQPQRPTVHEPLTRADAAKDEPQ